MFIWFLQRQEKCITIWNRICSTICENVRKPSFINFITHKLLMEKGIHKGEAGIVDFFFYCSHWQRAGWLVVNIIYFPLKYLLNSSKPLTTLKMDSALQNVLRIIIGNLEQKIDHVYINILMSTQEYPPPTVLTSMLPGTSKTDGTANISFHITFFIWYFVKCDTSELILCVSL